MSIQIETERLILREFEEGDAEVLNAICNQDYILKRMPDWKATVDQTRSFINWVKGQYALANRNTARVVLAVTLKKNNKLIGMVGIGNKEEVDNEIEIAYFVSEEFSNKGYTSEAANALSRWAFKSLNLHYLMAIVETDNYPSQRVIEKCGFTRLDTRMILNSGESQEKPFYYYRLYNAM